MHWAEAQCANPVRDDEYETNTSPTDVRWKILGVFLVIFVISSQPGVESGADVEPYLTRNAPDSSVLEWASFCSFGKSPWASLEEEKLIKAPSLRRSTKNGTVSVCG